MCMYACTYVGRYLYMCVCIYLNIGRPQTRWSHGISNANAVLSARSVSARGSNALSLSTQLREAITFIRNSVVSSD